MAGETQIEIDDRDDDAPFAGIDPWAALQDGRRQLTAALDASDPRAGARTLAIPEFANLGEAVGTLSVLLLAHAAHDRAHAAFFASLDAIGAVDRANTASEPDSSDWPAVRTEVHAARMAMLEAAAGLSSEHWKRRLSPPWVDAAGESLLSLLVVRAMCDGILADAVAALARDHPTP
jgi:hypothetical protein